jgi:hypothetical protein
MAFFPAEPGTRAALLEQIDKMVAYNEEAEWLAYRATQVFSTWPGIREIRALLCKRSLPKDGVEVDSQTFPDGFPSEADLGPVPVAGLLPSITEREALAAPQRLRLPEGHVASVDPEADQLVSGLAQVKGLSGNAKLRRFELDCHYKTLKMLEESKADPVSAVIKNQGGKARAHEFWHGVFQDFPELRGRFPCSQRFGPYDDAAAAVGAVP